MITLDDCAAFCDAHPDEVERLARDQHVAMPLAYAQAHAAAATVPEYRVVRNPDTRAKLMNFPIPETRIAA